MGGGLSPSYCWPTFVWCIIYGLFVLVVQWSLMSFHQKKKKRMKMKGLPNPINNIWFPIPCLVWLVVIIIYLISYMLIAQFLCFFFFLYFILGFSVCVQTGIGPQGPFFGSAKSEFALPLDKSPDQFLSRVQNFWVLGYENRVV